MSVYQINEATEIITVKKIYADTNTSNLKKVVLDVPAVEEFTFISDADILDYFYQGLLSFRFPTSLGGVVLIVNPDHFSVDHGVINTSVKDANGDSFAFTFEKVENTDHNYVYDVEVAITPVAEGLGDEVEPGGEQAN